MKQVKKRRSTRL